MVEEVKKLFEEITVKLTEVADMVRKAVLGYQDLPHSQRKDVGPAMDAARKAAEEVLKAIGAGWWVKWGRKVFYVVGGFLGVALILGILKILFEH